MAEIEEAEAKISSLLAISMGKAPPTLDPTLSIMQLDNVFFSDPSSLVDSAPSVCNAGFQSDRPPKKNSKISRFCKRLKRPSYLCREQRRKSGDVVIERQSLCRERVGWVDGSTKHYCNHGDEGPLTLTTEPS